MTMTHEEIVRHYQQAANPKQDIQVLADLNTTDTESIRAILVAAGVLEPDKPGRTRKYERKVEALAEQGLNNKEIANAIGCNEQTVARNRGGRPKKEKPAEAVSAPFQGPAPGIYERLDAILVALPPESSPEARKMAGQLCLALFGDYLAGRLGLEIGI